MSKPTPELYELALHVLYYLYLHKDVGLRYTASDRPVMGMSDSDWATKHSTSGSVFLWNYAAISWASKKQPTIALSSTEAEIMAASLGGAEAVYLRSLLDEMGFSPTAPTELRVDNQGAVYTAKYAGHSHSKLKHISRRHLWIRELMQEGKVNVSFIKTDDNVADLFTKPLCFDVFWALALQVGCWSRHATVRCCVGLDSSWIGRRQKQGAQPH